MVLNMKYWRKVGHFLWPHPFFVKNAVDLSDWKPILRTGALDTITINCGDSPKIEESFIKMKKKQFFSGFKCVISIPHKLHHRSGKRPSVKSCDHIANRINEAGSLYAYVLAVYLPLSRHSVGFYDCVFTKYTGSARVLSSGPKC